MRYQRILVYVLVVALAYVVGLVGTLASGWVVLSRLNKSPQPATTAPAQLRDSVRPAAPLSIDC